MRSLVVAAVACVAVSACAPAIAPTPTPDGQTADAVDDIRAPQDARADRTPPDAPFDAAESDRNEPDSSVIEADGLTPDAEVSVDVTTDTGVPPIDTGVPPTDTGVPPIDTGVPPIDTGVPPVDTGVPPVDTGVPPVDTGVCGPTQTLCGSDCVDRQSSTNHCGACGNVCSSGQSCVSGRCECPAGQTLCAGRCVNLAANASHCGACGNACTSPQLCESGRCALPCSSPEVACGSGAAMTCADLATNPNHCGACGNACPAGRVCAARSCVCPASQALCGGSCRVIASDPLHCGACGNACPATATCRAGSCQCPAGLSECGSSCVDTNSDRSNCGGCGRTCEGSDVCVAGACVSTCAAPRRMCGASCVDPRTDNNHCGACGARCTGNTACAASACAPTNATLATAVVVPSTPDGISTRFDSQLSLPGVDVGGCVNGATFYRFTLARRSIVSAQVHSASAGGSAITFVPDGGGGALGCGATDTRCGARTSELTSVLNAGTYYVAVGRRAPEVGPLTFELSLTAVAAANGQNIAYSSIGAEVRGRTSSSGSAALGSCRPGTDNAGEDAYYFTSCASDAGSSLQAETLGSWFDSVLHVAQTDALSSSCNDNGFASRIDARVLAPLPARGGLNVVYVDGARVSSGAYRLTIDYAPSCTAAGWLACGGRCIAPYDLLTDPNHCGACGNRCASGVCSAGSCAALPATLALGGTVLDGNSTTLGAAVSAVFACQFDEMLVGFRGSMSADESRITSLQTLCQRANTDATAVNRLRFTEPPTQSSAQAGTIGAQSFTVNCPEHHVVTGVRARVTGTTFGELRFDCAPLATTSTSPIAVSAISPRLTVASIGAGGGTLLPTLCATGTVATGFVSVGSTQIDGLALRCSTPRVTTPVRQAIVGSNVAAPGGGAGVDANYECPAGTMVDGLELYSLPPSTTFTGVRARCRSMSALYADAGDFVIAQRGASANGTLLGTVPIGARTDVLSCGTDQVLAALSARGSAAGINGAQGTCVVARVPYANGAGRTTAGGTSNYAGVIAGSTAAALCPANQVAVGITARINGGALVGLGYRCAAHSGT